jgi:hypothetical protein
MFPLKKGTTANQAHVGLPTGTYEEEHGRKGFFGKSAHLYHANPPTSWIRFEGKLRPHCFDCNKLEPTDSSDPKGAPVAFLGNQDLRVLVSRRSEPMPFYFRNADGDELYFVHRGEGTLETDFGPLAFEKGDYIVIPRAVTYRVVPKTKDNFFLIVESRTEFEQPEKGLIGQHALYDPAIIVTPEQERMGGAHQGRRGVLVIVLSVQSNRRGGMEGGSDGLEDQHARHQADHESSGSSSPERAYHLCDAGCRRVQLPPETPGGGSPGAESAVLPPQHRLRRIYFLP